MMEIRLALVLALVLSSTGAFAASFELTGTVLDESGVELAGATLTLVHEGTGLVRTTTSNDSGRYAFPATATGEYSLVSSPSSGARPASFESGSRASGFVLEVKSLRSGSLRSIPRSETSASRYVFNGPTKITSRSPRR